MTKLIKQAEMCPGISGPDALLIELEGGQLIEIGNEGINAYVSLNDYIGGAIPFQSTPLDISLP